MPLCGSLENEVPCNAASTSEPTLNEVSSSELPDTREYRDHNQTVRKGVKQSGRRLSHPPKLMAHPMGIAIVVVWIISCLGALFLNIFADVFQGEAPAFPLIPTIATSFGLNVFCAILSVLFGKWTLPYFKVFQPFSGGCAFIVMQGFGYSILVITSLASFVYLDIIRNEPEKQVYSTFIVLGSLSTLAEVCLVMSLFFYEDGRRRYLLRSEKHSKFMRYRNELWWGSFFALSKGEIALVACFSFVLLGCSLVAECLPGLRSLVAAISGFFLIFGILTINFSTGYNCTPGFRLLVPDAGTLRMNLIQAFGWFLAFATLHLDLILFVNGMRSPDFWHIFGGLCSVFSFFILLFFAYWHRFEPNTQSIKYLRGEYAPFVLTLVCLFQAVIMCSVALVLSLEEPTDDLVLRPIMVMSQRFSSLFFFIFPFCTHLLARISIFGENYIVWSPFNGPVRFSLLQIAGWFCFACGLFFATSEVTERHYLRFTIIQSSLAAFSQCCIFASLYVFAADEEQAIEKSEALISSVEADPISKDKLVREFLDAKADGSTSGTIDDEEETPLREEDRSLFETVFNGEMLTAVLLCIVGLLIRVMADVSSVRSYEIGYFLNIPKSSFLILADVISFVVVPMAHVSCRKRIAVFLPFVGCGGYVGMQSIGWSLYAVNMTVVVANGFLDKRKSLLLLVADDHDFFFEHTMEGFMVSIPFVCIIMGAFFEANAEVLRKSFNEDLRQKVLILQNMVQTSIENREEARHMEAVIQSFTSVLMKSSSKLDKAAQTSNYDATRVRPEAAKHIVVILSVTGFLVFMLAAFLAEQHPVFTLVVGVAGLVLTTVSCFSVHYVYGAFLYRASGRYLFFMPFSGGSTFIALQSLGWGFYAATLLLMVMSCAEVRGSAVVFATAGVFSTAAQFCILHSVPRFDPTVRPKSFFERNAEGILALLTLVGSFAFSMAYDLYTHGGVSKTASSLLPITLSAVSMCFAVPLGLVSLKRQSRRLWYSPFSVFEGARQADESENFSDDAMDEDEDVAASPTFPLPQEQMSSHITQEAQSSDKQNTNIVPNDSMSQIGTDSFARNHWRSASSSLRTLCFMIASVMAIVLTLLMPFAFVCVTYCWFYSGINTLRFVFNSLYTLLGGFALAVLVPMFLAPSSQRKSQTSTKWGLYSTWCCFAIYSVPTLVTGIPLTAPFFIKTTGSWIFMGTMVVLSCISAIPYVYIVTMLANVCCAGCLLYYHIYFCFIEGYADFIPWEFVLDMVLTTFWVFYFRRYVGRPHVTGSFMSPRVRSFFKKSFWEGIEDYFSLRIAVDGRNGEEADGSFVDMRDPKNKYIFSYHPHGVFPGTALWIPSSGLWEKTVGSNDRHHVTGHSADVVFSVPFLRDVVMSIGGMSVTRRGIENSLKQGHSPLIVTGGQAEMLYTKFSDTEMHLVTHHSGFVRLALVEQVPLVPLICFAEHNIWGNISLPQIQQYTRKVFGFPFPTLPYGRWYLPLPVQRPLFIAVGKPIFPEAEMCAAESAEHVERYRQRYFEELTKLFFKYRAEAGYPNMSLVLHHFNEVTRIDKL